MKRSAEPKAPAPKTAQDVSSELIKIEQSISEGAIGAAAALQAISVSLASFPVVSGAFIALYQGPQLVCVASAGAAPAVRNRIPTDGLVGECLQTGRLVRCLHASEDPRVDPMLRHELRFESMLCVPVQSRCAASGVLVVLSAQPDSLEQEYVFILGSAANLAAAIAVRLPAMEETEYTESQDTSARDSEAKATVAVDADTAAANLSSLVEAGLDSVGPGSRIDLTALVSELTTPPTVQPDTQESLIAAPPVIPQRVWSSPRLRNGAAVVLGLLVFSSALYPAIRGRQAQPTPAVRTIAAVTGSTDETIGRPTPAVAGHTTSPVIVGGQLRNRTAPVYPQNALRNSLQGEVSLVATVNEAGIVTETRVLSGEAELADSAIRAVAHWRFAPFMTDGRPLLVNLPVTIAFHCSGDEASTSTHASLPPNSARPIR